MIKKILVSAIIFLSTIVSINSNAATLTCDQYYNQWYFGVLTATDTPVPYVIDFTQMAPPSTARSFQSYAPPSIRTNGFTTSSCSANPDGSLTTEADNAEQPDQMFFVAVMSPAEPGVWNVVRSNLPGMPNHNYVGKLRLWDPTIH